MSTRNEGRAAWGAQAIKAGTPDYGLNGEDFAGFQTDAVDAITNILHAVALRAAHAAHEGDSEDLSALAALSALTMAREHLEAELDADDIERSMQDIPYPLPPAQ